MVLGPGPRSFKDIFEERWCEHLRTLPRRYQESKQLVKGSRFRPLLVAWGYLLSDSDFCETKRSEVADLSVHIELLHKASILIDDIIDKDDARGGRASFHIEFSEHEAILFGVFLLGDSLQKLSFATRNIQDPERRTAAIELLSKTIKDMALGGLEEVGLDYGHLALIAKVRQLIELQTISLVKNGLLIGYSYGLGSSVNENLVDSLGHDCGYLFQVLNDLEPFLGRDLNAEHKGAINPDLIRSRKNITVAFIFDTIDPRDRAKLLEMRRFADPGLTAALAEWFARNSVLDVVIENLERVRKNIDMNSESLKVEKQRRREFLLFIDYVLAAALARLEPTYCKKLSEILIR